MTAFADIDRVLIWSTKAVEGDGYMTQLRTEQVAVILGVDLLLSSDLAFRRRNHAHLCIDVWFANESSLKQSWL